MAETLNDELTVATKLGFLRKEVTKDISDNLSSLISLRPYQINALERFLYFIEEYPEKPKSVHLLFHMATGSGKTVLMAALILDLYKRGYRNFLFFVNSTQIIEKTKENFLNGSSAKYLFAPQIRIDNGLVEIQAVENFEAVNLDAINIHFTTIQGLHSRMQSPRENTITLEDFQNYKVAMISDEAHHLSTETKRILNQTESEAKKSWEGTAATIFGQHPENLLLEFTATVDMGNVAIQQKYQDKLLYDYPLRQFRADGYSKDIELRQADLQPRERMMQAMVLSQYRRKVAEAYGIHCKPVVLMKSKTIKESSMNEKLFAEMVTSLNGETLQSFRIRLSDDNTLAKAFDYIIDDRSMEAADFARELKGDFGVDKVVNVNELRDLEKQQIELNTLENRSNELRVIFAVDKLNEGWDVLNLFDIVRLYDTRDTRANKVGRTTMAEAQLIGRGARYFPFSHPDQRDLSKFKRKFDNEISHPLRILEELHYHCSHNPKYIQEIRSALRQTGILAEQERKVKLRLKDSFKQSPLYKKGFVWTNSRVKNERREVNGLNAYIPNLQFTYTLRTSKVTVISAFDDERENTRQTIREDSRTIVLNLVEFGRNVVGFAMDTRSFFHFSNLRTYFPQLTGSYEFFSADGYLGGVTVAVVGTQEAIENMTSQQKLEIACYILGEIESAVKRESVEYVGTKSLEPHKISDRFFDIDMKLRAEGETAKSWIKGESEVEGVLDIDLTQEAWHAYDDSYGTDQEKHFIKFMKDQMIHLQTRYDDFYLLRNEKAVKLFAVNDGLGFEPDYLLFLLEQGANQGTVLQLFIEPKGSHLYEHDRWKENLLLDLNFKTVFQGRNYVVYGLPFFNEEGDTNTEFKRAFGEVLEDK